MRFGSALRFPAEKGAAWILNGGCSDDGFCDFRRWLISQGEKTFERALADPDSLAQLDIQDDAGAEFEVFGYVAYDVYEAKTGKEMPTPQMRGSAEPRGERWNEDDLDRLLPKLCQRYG